MADTEQYKQAVSNRYITQVKIGESFDTNRAAITYILDGDSPGYTGVGSSIADNLPSYSLKQKRRDTRVGGNDAINSYYQFNENDDLVHPINKTGIDGSGMGRVYNETFDEQQQILYLSFGVPDFTNAVKFIDKAYDKNLALLMNTGDPSTIQKIGFFLGEVLGTVVKLPFIPFIRALDLLQADSPTKYYDFRPTMALYYKLVNVILAHIAVNMDLAGVAGDGNATDGIPDLLKTHGLDILTILCRKHWYDDALSVNQIRTDEIIKALQADKNAEKSMWENANDGLRFGFTEALRYVGFRIEKSTDSSESASNSTKEPEILNLINQQVQAGRERTVTMSTLANSTVGGAIKGVYDMVSSVISGAASTINIQGGVEVLKGSGFVDIPEVWASSNFSKSYSFDFQLRTPYGDPFSIFYSLYIPLAMLLAGAFPRSVGQNTYTSPFLVRAYCQGMFAIPLGIIDSITIRRGAPEYGWADSSGRMLPTQIDVSFTIKDLSPIMHIALADGGIDDWLNILGQNSSFQEYMLTLSGVDVAQRTLKTQLIKNRKKALLQIASNNKFNALMFGFSLTNSRIGRALTTLTPFTRVPGSIPKP